MRGFRRSLFFAAVALAATACSEVPSTPGTTGSGRIALAPSFSTSAVGAYNALAAFGLDITQVHVRLTAPDGSTRDTTIAFPAGTDTLHVEMAVPLRTAGEAFTADVEMTNSDGVVLFSGRQQVTAQASNIPGGAAPASITINYTGPGKDVKLLTLSPATQLVTGIGSTPIVATGVDASGAAVSSLLVRWTTSDASVATVTAVGTSSATVTTTGKRGVVTISALTALGITGTSTFTVVPPPARVVVISGSGQTGAAGKVLAQPLIVEVQAADNLPVPGAAVSFRAVTSGASVGNAAATSDGSGRASSPLTLGRTPGAYQFEASSGSLPPVQAAATATAAPPASIVIVSGSGQTGTVGSSLALPLVAKVLDEFGAVVGGAAVQWSKLSGGGTLGATSTTSAADGTTSTTYTLGTVATTENIRASLPGVTSSTADFSVKATAGAPFRLTSAGTGQHTPVGSALPGGLAVRVVDAFNNPVSGVDVFWRVASSAGATATFAPTVSQTDINGAASTTVTLGGTPGSLTLMAVVGGLSATFVETADPSGSSPGTLSGFVFDAVTNSALSGVSVTIIQGSQTVMTAVTSSSGNYSTAQLAGGTYDVQYAINGYVTTTISALIINGNTVAQVVPLVPSSSSPGSIAGFVFDATTNQTVQGTITLELRSGVNSTTGAPLQSVSASNGSYLFSNVPAGTYTVVVIAGGYANATKTGIAVGATTTSNQNIYISPSGAAGLVRIVLTWRASPRDLDSYLSGPIAGSQSRFLVYYGSPQTCSVSPFACLDQDVTSGFGPETITISQMTAGTYLYSVNNYSGSPPLSTSGARVDVYINNALQQSFFVPPNGTSSDLTWNVFSLNGSVITPINTYNGAVTSRTPNIPGISATVAPSHQSTMLTPRTDAALIDEMKRLHPKSGRTPQ